MLSAATFPSPVQLALALVLLRNTPPDLSAKEFLTNLRRRLISTNVTDGRPRNEQPPDSVGWEQAYHDFEHITKHYQTQIAELRAENEDLRMRYAADIDRSRPRKRKAAWSAGGRRKTLRIQSYADLSYEEVLAQVQDVGKKDRVRMERPILALAALLSTESIPATHIEHNVIDACKECNTVLDDNFSIWPINSRGTGQRAQTIATSNPQIECLFISVEILIKLSIMALERLQEMKFGLEPSIFAIAGVIDRLLNCLTDLRAMPAEMKGEQPNTGERSGRITGSKTGIERREISAGISKLVIGVVEIPGLPEIGTGKLIDAFSCMILQHTGRTLSALSLLEPIPDPNRQSCTASLPLNDPLDGSLDLETRERLGAAKTGPYLIFILEKLLTVLGSDWLKSIRPPSIANKESSGRVNSTGLRVRTWERLQKTLLQSVFGDRGQEALSELRRPPVPALDSTVAGSVDDVKPNARIWFIDKIWNLIGWETLAHELVQSSVSSEQLWQSLDHRGERRGSMTHEQRSRLQPTTLEPELVCYCRDVEYGKTVKCGNPSCPYACFHLSCIGLKRMPAKSVEWLCARCKSIGG